MYYGCKENRAEEIKKELGRRVVNAVESEYPKEVIENLQRWSLLYDVPLEWLCPEMSRIPPESFRFFQVDLNWVAALLDGSLSLGRKSDFIKMLHKQYGEKIVCHALTSNANVRRRMLHKKEVPLMQSTSEIHLPQMSGFFLQSKMVSDCPGLEIEVQDCQRQRLDILRMERLQNALLLCIVKGNISRVVIQGAAEDSHFACEEDNHIILRNLDMGSSTDLKIPVVFRDEEMGTVDFEKMAKSIQGVAEAQKITSAEFAMEWMNRDYQGVIEIGGK